MTQTVTLTQPVRVSGSVLAAGTTQTLARDIAADLVARGFATPVGVPLWQSTTQSSSKVIAQSNIPFLIMPGDGGSNGCSFSGTAGAFTLSAAILANTGAALAGCYAYFSASFGGSTLPAGWYWTEFSSDTAGIVYANTYTSGTPLRPATKTPISVNLTGRITATTNEITCHTALSLPKGSLGKNGKLQAYWRCSGSTAGTKSYRMRGNDAGTTSLCLFGTTTSPLCELITSVDCVDSETVKFTGRNASSGLAGVTGASNVMPSNYAVSTFDTSIDQQMSLTMQQSTNVSTPVLLGICIEATYGE